MYNVSLSPSFLKVLREVSISQERFAEVALDVSPRVVGVDLEWGREAALQGPAVLLTEAGCSAHTFSGPARRPVQPRLSFSPRGLVVVT